MRRMPVRDGELLTLAVGIGFGEHDFVAFGNFDKRLPLGVAGVTSRHLICGPVVTRLPSGSGGSARGLSASELCALDVEGRKSLARSRAPATSDLQAMRVAGA
jgi:hypothetical protein